ncbi:MAG TPA: Ig-like domain-containing protein [Actinomycetes bacterium]|nr:Ig-like domain-containing protein [Actinomycetes bacterium]
MLLAPLLLLAVALAGTGAPDPARAAEGDPTAPQIRSYAAGATAWKLGKSVRVRAVGATLTAVTLTGPDGRPVRGRLAPDEWTSKGKLAPKTTYALEALAVAPDGRQATLSDTVRTGAPERVLRATISPGGRTVGVGRPVVVSFNQTVRRKKDVERALSVTTSRPVGPASWSWTSSRTVQFRPKRFWPANTRVRVAADLRKVHAGPGLWGMRDTRTGFAIGRSLVMKVSNSTLRMNVVRNGETVRTFGVSMGKSGFTTRSGTKVIMSKHTSYRMRSTTVGITGSEAYDLDVPYAMRITSSGEFLHGAPWNPYVGTANRSHGCTNLTLSAARWVFSQVREGDPIVTRGTGRPTEPYNGLGGVWNVPWKTWVAGSALS